MHSTYRTRAKKEWVIQVESQALRHIPVYRDLSEFHYLCSQSELLQYVSPELEDVQHLVHVEHLKQQKSH
jgi:hypothetical protein